MVQNKMFFEYRKNNPGISEYAFATEIKNEIIDIAKKDNPEFSYKNNISTYGNTHPIEFFAEVFANSQMGMPNELGKAMLKWLKQKGFLKE